MHVFLGQRTFKSSMVFWELLFFTFSFLFFLNSASNETQACFGSLGLENGQIKDHQLSASSYLEHMFIFGKGTVSTKPKYGRLNSQLAWCGLHARRPSQEAPYFQVNFGQIVKVSGLATQGFKTTSSYYVKTYTVRFSLDGLRWFDYSSPNTVWIGNSDASTIQKVKFNKLIVTKYLRIYPQSSKVRICLRTEVYGCRINETGSSTQPSTISTQEPSTISTQEPSTISTQEPSTIPTQQPSSDEKKARSLFSTPLPIMNKNISRSFRPTTLKISEFALLTSSPSTKLVTSHENIFPEAGVSEVKKSMAIILVTSTGFAVLLAISVTICFVLRRKQQRDISQGDFLPLAIDAGVLESESFKTIEESCSGKWV